MAGGAQEDDDDDEVEEGRGGNALPGTCMPAIFVLQPVGDQVRSLTQIYSVDFLKSRVDVKKCVFNKRTIKVCVSCY